MKCVWFKLVGLSFLLILGCNSESKKTTLEMLPHMMDSPALKAQKLGPDGIAMRVPVEGTIPQGYEPYRYANDPEGAGKNLKNPLRRTHEVLARGQKLYNTYCIVCHGVRGEGDGSVVPKFPRPPSLSTDKVRGWPDGRIYHVISIGQNLMPSYASQLDPVERWAVVQYVRVLQKASSPNNEDLRAAGGR